MTIKKSLTLEIGSKHATKRSNNECEFVIEITNAKDSKIFPYIKSLFAQNNERFEVEIMVCDKINQSKGLIYIHDYSKLNKEYNLLDVQKTTRIKTKNTASTPLTLTFKEKELQRFLEIPEEPVKYKV